MRVLELDTPSQGYKTTFTLPSTKVWNKFCFHCKSWKCRGTSKDCILWAVNSDHFWRGGWQLYASFSQSFFHQFWKSQCSFGSKYPEFSNTPPTFAFWMSLRVVMAIFPRNDIFFGTLCIFRREWRRQQVSLATHSWLGLLHSTFHVDIWPPSPLKEDASEG